MLLKQKLNQPRSGGIGKPGTGESLCETADIQAAVEQSVILEPRSGARM